MSESKPASVVFTNAALLANQAQQTANQAVASAAKYRTAWEEANSENLAALSTAQSEFESNLAWAKSQIYEGQHQNDSAVASLQSDMESSWNSMSTVEESLYNSAITATSEVDSHLESLRAQNSQSLADLHNTANSLHAAANSLHADADSMRGSLMAATSELGNDLANARNSLAAVDADLRNGIKQAGTDLANAKTSLMATGNSLANRAGNLATATSELQRQTGQLSGSLSTADSMIMFNSNAIAEVKRTAGEISSTVSNIRVGDRNLARGVASSQEWFTFDGFYGGTNDWRNLVNYSLDTLKAGDKVTFGVTIKNDGVTSGTMFFQQDGNASEWTRDYGAISPAGNVTDFVPNGAEKALTYTIPITDGMLNGNSAYTINIRTDNVPAGGKLSFRYAFVKKGTMATDWTPAPEDTDQAISTVSQTADAIREDLTNTKGDVASVKATASSLQSQITDNKNNISSVEETAQGLTTRVSNAEGNISAVKQTATSLQSSLSNAQGDISTLKQTANGLTSTVSAAMHNNDSLVKTTMFMNGLGEWNTYNAQDAIYVTDVNDVPNSLYTKALHSSARDTLATKQFIPVTPGDKYSVEIYFNSHGFSCGFGVHTTTSSYSWARLVSIESTETGWVRKKATWTVPDDVSQAMAWVQLDYDADNTLPANRPNVWIAYASFTKIDSVLDDSISQIKQTADRIQTQVNDNKGNISLVTQTANAVKTDLANTKGDISSLKQTATGLQSTVESQSGQISQLQQDADGLSAIVGGAAIDLITNLDQPFVMGYGIANTTWQDNNSYIKLPTAKNAPEVLPQTAGFLLNIPLQAGKTYMQSIIFETDATINDSIQPQWTWFMGSHDVRSATLAKLGDNTYRLIGSYTPTQAKVDGGQLRIFDIVNFTEFVNVTTGTYLKFRNPRIWSPDDNSLAQLKLTADGLQSTVAGQDGKISQLQHDADGLKLTAIGGGNLLNNTSGTLQSFTVDNWVWYITSADEPVAKHQVDGQTVTLSAWIENPSKEAWVQMYTDTGMAQGNRIPAGGSGWSQVTYTMPSGFNGWNIVIGCGDGSGTITLSYSSLQLELGPNRTAWSQSTADITQLKVTADGIRADLTNASGDIASVNAKADSLTTSMANANNQISTLQQRADSIIRTLSNGGRNLLSNTREINDPSIWGNLTLWDKGDFYHDGGNDCQIVQTSTQQWNGLKQYVFVEAGRKYTFSIDAKSGDNSNHTANFYITLNNAQEGPFNKAEAIGDGQTLNYTPTWTRYSFTITATTNGYVAPRIERSTTTNELLQLARPQFEYGDTATPWKPSNGDISSLQQTAQGLTADMKDAKGNISNLQVSAGRLTTDMTDANKNVSSLQQTAKELDAQIKSVDGKATTIKATADGISARVSRIEGNKVVGSLLKLDGNEAGLGTYVNNKLIAGINTNPDGVCITGKNLYLNGQTHIDDGVINASKITVHNSVGNADGSATDQLLAVAWGQLNSTIGKTTDNGKTTLWGSINQTADKFSSYYTRSDIDGKLSQQSSLISQTAENITAIVNDAKNFATYTVSSSNTWNFDYTKSVYGNWFLNGDTSGNYVYNGPKYTNGNRLTPFMFVTSRGPKDGSRFVVTVWKDNDPTQYQRVWSENKWSEWVMLPNSQNLISAINLSPDSVKISGKNIELNGNTKVTGRLDLMQDSTRSIAQSINYHNPWNWNNAHIYFDNYLQLLGEDCNVWYTDTKTPLNGGNTFYSITTLTPGYLKFTTYRNKVNLTDENFDGQISRSYLDSGRLETPEVYTDKFAITGHHIRVRDNRFLMVTNKNGTNFDNYGSVGFQVWGGIVLGKNTIGAPSSELYFQRGNIDAILGQRYSDAPKVTLHAQKVVSQEANSVSSRLSVKTAITKVPYGRALMAVQNTDMYDYKYISDDSSQHYVSGIIDDIHDKPEYNMDPMLINQERTARIDANLLGYHHVVLQEILKRLDKLEAK